MGRGHNAGGIREATRSVLAAGHHRALGSRTVGWGSSRGTMRHIPAGTGLGQQHCKAGGLSGRHRALILILNVRAPCMGIPTSAASAGIQNSHP